MSGSAVADAAGMGLIEAKAMGEKGFPKEFTGAITAASSIISPIIPPSIAGVIYAVMANQSVGRMFLGGIIPGLLMGGLLMIAVYIIAKKNNYPREDKAPLKKIFISFLEASLALITPIIILGAIYTGVATPTEAAIIAVIYSGLVGEFVYKEIKIKELPKILYESALATALTMSIIATASMYHL